ncbi:UNKNOWN [Stylonychia lemnae]|uniref:Ef hand family protein n=1 Tax=Stylonychia lemnae TaxID=5949 RepID=A0A077ZQP1_STYLE|nr:UNKNOWN [Stylonychia lemnae]|eukprot:CDW71705.1 UNKNOWN [Stylonychia lemnae]
MMLLSKERLQKLEVLWEDYPDGLELPLFTQLMLDSIECSEEEKYELVHGALKLFSDIDINGDAHMEWSEFMQYIIDAVLENSISNSNDDKKMSVMELIQQMKANRFLRFYMAYNPIDKSNHTNYIINAAYSKKANLIMSFEKHSKEVKFHTPDLRFKEKFQVPLRVEGFILGIDYSDSQLVFGCTASDSQLHFYIQTSKGIRFMKSIVTPGIQSRIWHMPNHKCWITAGRDLKLRQWDPFKTESLITTFNEDLKLHNQEIMDVCEIDNPFSIATCSLDKKIVIYNLIEREPIRILKGDHIKGVKRLSYNGHFGGHLVSVGHEIYANVWGPESLISDILIGKLKGHTKPIIDTKFISITPFNVTIDEKNNIRIWDIRTLQCLQLVKGKVQTAAQGICSIQNNVFWIYGKRFIQFDTYSVEEGGEEQKDNQSENYPIWAEFNTYYMSINVVNKQDLQVSILLGMKQNYMIAALGGIKVYNVGNGVELKDCTHDGDDNDGPSKNGDQDDDNLTNSSYSSIKEDSFNNSKAEDAIDQSHKEITGLQLIWEENYIMMICSDHKYIYVYDEEDTESSEQLRKITGAHREEITIIKYDDHLSLLASGSIDGEIAVWDFEMSKLLGMCIGHTGDITGIEFVTPYPIMVTSSLDCTVCIWGVRPCNIAYRYISLYRFENISFNYNKDSKIAVSKILIIKDKMKGIQRHKRLNDGYLVASKYGSFNVNVLFKKIEDKVQNDLFNASEQNTLPKKSVLSRFLAARLNKKSPPVENDYERKLDQVFERCYMYVADEAGFIKVWDLTNIIKKIGFSPADNYPQKKVSFNPKRKETIDCTIFASSMRNDAKKQKLPDILNPEKVGIFIREVKAHRECIVSMNPIQVSNGGGLITCSTDRRVRVWSSFLDLWGTIDQRQEKIDKRWCFPQDFKRKQKESEIDQVKGLLNEVELEADKNLIFKEDDKNNEQKNEEKSQKFWLMTRKQKYQEQIQTQKTERKEFDVRMQFIEHRLQNQKPYHGYHGYAKELERILDAKQQRVHSENKRIHQTMPVGDQSNDIQAIAQKRSMLRIQDHKSKKNLLGDYQSAVPQALNNQKSQNMASRNVMSRIGNIKCSQKSMMGDTNEKEKNYQVDENKYFEHQIQPGIRLPPMNVTPKHRNYSFEQKPQANKKIKHQFINESSRNTLNASLLEQSLDKRRQSQLKNQTQAYSKGQFITSSDQEDAIQIKTDYIIDDINDYQGRKQKYFGDQSAIKLLVKEENLKIQHQRRELKKSLKLPKYPK